MTSTNYTIESDVVGFGGDISSSTGDTYSLYDTAGDNAPGTSTSTTYTINAGFRAMDGGSSISLTIGNSSLSFGTLSAASVSSVSTDVDVTVTSDTGYSLSVSSQSGSLWTTLTGSVDAGSQEFGVLVSGTDQAFAGTAALSNGLVLASNNSAITSETRTTALSFQVAMSSATASGSYTKSITLTASANP